MPISVTMDNARAKAFDLNIRSFPSESWAHGNELYRNLRYQTCDRRRKPGGNGLALIACPDIKRATRIDAMGQQTAFCGAHAMSPLGRERTFALQQTMPALPLAQAYARAAAVLVDELDASDSEGASLDQVRDGSGL